jgi:hypothetical protein
MRTVRVLLSSLGFIFLIACGGGGDTPPPSNNPPSNNPPPNQPVTDPCAGVSIDPGDLVAELATGPLADRKRRPRGTGDPRGDLLEELWTHDAAARLGLTRPLEAGLPTGNEDIGDIAVLQDSGDLIVRANQFDLDGVALRFTPSGSGYTLATATGGFRTALGARVVLEDDDSEAFDVPFAFTYFGTTQARGFVNSDGNITFGEGDSASTDRSVSRFLSGAPRVSPFFADLDPATGSGRVFLATGADGVTVTWCNVRGFDLTDTVTVQTTLLPTGVIDVRFGPGIGLDDAVVGLSPGHTGQFSTVDLSTVSGSAGDSTAIGERFSKDSDIDLVAVARKFYQTHPDSYDQLVIWTDTRVVSGNTFAYETTIANEIRGIGNTVFDSSRDFGSAGRLRSLVLMDALTKYPTSPTQRFLGEDSTLSLLGHETGHRWLALLRFRDAAGRRSDELLGRDQAHWSFFFDSDASFMEGNDIEDLGGGAFRTIGAVRRYSLLDQYAMGLVTPSQVSPFFYVEAPTNSVPERERDDAPDTGVTFNGTRREVRIDDVIDVMGRREPASAASPKTHRQAFLYVVSNGRTLDSAQVDKLDRIRRDWPAFFRSATSNRMTLETKVR